MFIDRLIGASLNLEFDHDRVRDEILSCREFWKSAKRRGNLMQEALDGSVPFLSESLEQYEIKSALRDSTAAKRVYLKEYDGLEAQSFLVTKLVDHSYWKWSKMAEERCPYTIELIEQLPFKQIGAVSCVIFENTFLPTHRDYMPDGGPQDRTKTLGLSLVPVTGGVATQIWHPTEKKIYEIKGSSTLFDDSMFHGVAYAPMRMIIRVFGELDWDVLESRIDQDTAIYL